MKKTLVLIFNFILGYLFLRKTFLVRTSEAEILKRIMFKNGGKYYPKVKRNGMVLIKAPFTLGSFAIISVRGISALIVLETLDEFKTEVKFKSRPMFGIILLPIGLSTFMFFQVIEKGKEGLWFLLLFRGY